MSKLLQFANFQELINWSVKTNLSSLIESKYKVVTLGNHIIEQKDKVKPFDFPEDDFKILGVSNKVGLFDNEIKKGKEINQAYKIVKNGYLAYNPYRINVGSIGLKTDEQKYDLISPAYVVFSCKETLLPEFLFLIFKTQTFNTIINESTRGSVRQILAFDILETLKIPLPTIEEQKEIILKIKSYKNTKNVLEENYIALLKSFKESIFNKEIKNENQLLIIKKFSEIENWSVHHLINSDFGYNKTFKMIKIGSFLKRNKTQITIDDDTVYKRVTIKLYSKGVSIRDYEIGKNIGTKKQYKIKEGQFLVSKIDARNGAFGIATNELNEAIITADFFAYDIDENVINPYFLSLITSTNEFLKFAQNSSTGTTNRQRLKEELFLNVEIPLPSISEQKELIKDLENNLIKQEAIIKNKDLAIQSFEREIFNEA
ncbi:restriction endonuclease subunit S [Aliarcobacter cryaerophilus]|uniref:restriction endonuclease subunit S n=1 Tax=Aliarcobacter cryaerophilus TaxID=28198 RepID=UPI003DA63844